MKNKMIRKVFVNNRRFFHFLYWSKYILAIVFSFYFLITGILFYIGYRERISVQKKSFSKIFQARKREIINLKLSGLEPYIWKKAFHCENINANYSNEDEKLKKKNCIHTKLTFIKEKQKKDRILSLLNNLPNNQPLILKQSKTQFIWAEKMQQACSICHVKEKDLPVQYTFYGNLPQPNLFFAHLYKNKYFILFHILWFIFWISYFIFRYLLYKAKKLNLIAFNFQFAPNGLKKFLDVLSYNSKNSSIRKKNKNKLIKKFIFFEAGASFIRGYLHPKEFNQLLRIIFESKIFTNETYTYRGAAIKINELFYSSFSFEGLKYTFALMQKVGKNNLIIENDILDKKNNLLTESEKKALWKTNTGEYEFKIIQHTNRISIS